MVPSALVKSLFLIATLALYCATTNTYAQKSFCSEEEATKAPCMCCKMRCWYNIQAQAKNILGHVPGTRGEGEAVETLSTMGQCVASLCGDVCTGASSPKRRQHQHQLLAALGGGAAPVV